MHVPNPCLVQKEQILEWKRMKVNSIVHKCVLSTDSARTCNDYQKIANSPADTCFIHRKGLHSPLHPIKTGALPYKINAKPMVHVNRNSLPQRKQQK